MKTIHKCRDKSLDRLLIQTCSNVGQVQLVQTVLNFIFKPIKRKFATLKALSRVTKYLI